MYIYVYICIYMYIYIYLNALHNLPHGCDIDWLPQLVSYSCSTYDPMMYLLWWINSSLFNGCVRMSNGFLDDSIGIIDIVELATYALKWWCFTLIYFSLASWLELDSMPAPRCLHRTSGETVPLLYPRAFFSFGVSMIGMVLRGA